MSGLKTILQSAAVVLLICACAVPAWVPPAGHPADPDAPDGTRTSPTALKRYRESAAAVETANPSPSDTTTSDSESDKGGEKDNSWPSRRPGCQAMNKFNPFIRAVAVAWLLALTACAAVSRQSVQDQITRTVARTHVPTGGLGCGHSRGAARSRQGAPDA